MSDPARALRSLIDTYGLHEPWRELNEATTRLLVIDVILSEVLGWPKECFSPEEPATADDFSGGRRHTSWLDYHLKHPSTPQRLVVEAKKAGASFSLGRTRKRRRVRARGGVGIRSRVGGTGMTASVRRKW